MGISLHHVRGRVALALLSAGLLVGSAGVGPAAAAGARALPSGCTWTIHALPVPTGWIDVRIIRGDGSFYVGTGTDPTGRSHTLLWHNGGVTALKAPGENETSGRDVNRHGVALGVADFNDLHPVLWIKGHAVRLAAPAGSTSTNAFGINDAGIVVGTATVNGATHGIVWSVRTPWWYRDLGVGDGALSLSDVNDAGTVVGTTTDDADWPTSFRALRGTVTGGLSSMPGVDPADDSLAFQTNGRYVVGSGRLPGASERQSLVWHGDVATALPSLMSGSGVNSSGLVAGFTNAAPQSAVVWHDGTVEFLPDLNPDAVTGNSSAVDVMDNGTVVGSSLTADGGESLPVSWNCV